jgi:hypothetical protein
MQLESIISKLIESEETVRKQGVFVILYNFLLTFV